MNSFFKTFFASLLAQMVTAALTVIIIFAIISGLISKTISSKNGATEDDLKGGAVLTIDLSQTMHEQGADNALAAFNNKPAHSAGLYEAIAAIKKAKEDNRIQAIVIKCKGSSNGWATSEQLRDALVDFKASKKPILAYGESITQKDYYVASVADILYLNPVGTMELKGLAAELTFFKGALDKLEVEPEIFYAGKFKSATEPFRADKMSDPNRLQLTAVLQGLWGGIAKAAAEKAGVDTATANQWAATGAIRFASDAERLKLINGAKYWDELEEDLRRKLNLKTTDDIPYVSLADYSNRQANKTDDAGGNIAVLFAEGEIVDGTGNDDQIASGDMVKTIREIRDDKKIKAVVLRVNSPGGSGLASEVILRELQLLHKEKPVVVSMGDYAASGGYYIACAADSLFAMPNTITGSIGVFSMLFNVNGLMTHKLGVTFDGVKTAPYADFPSATRGMSDDEKKRMQDGIDTFYHNFMSRVSVARHIPVDQVDSIAQGRVWTGTDALRIGLVDGIGNLDRALKSAATLAKLSSYSINTYPDKTDKLSKLFQQLSVSATATKAMQQAASEELGPDYQYYRQLQHLRKTSGQAMMAMPYMLDIR